MSQIAWSCHNRMAFISESGDGYQVFIIVNNIGDHTWRWNAILAKITGTLKRLCENDVVNCKDQVFKGHSALSQAYNIALTVTDDNCSFILTLLLKDNQGHQNLLHVRRGIWLKYEPMSLNLTLPDNDAINNNMDEQAKEREMIFQQTSLLKERPRNVDDVAFLTITTDLWDNVFVTRDVKRYMCQKYSERVSSHTTDDAAGNEAKLEHIDEMDLAKNIILDTTYWYARRFLIPPNNEKILSSSAFIFLLKPLAEICSDTVVDKQQGDGEADKHKGLDGVATTLASLIEAASVGGIN